MPLRRVVKSVLGRALYASGVARRVWRHRALVVVFHRVDARYPANGLTCTPKRFAAFCAFFRRYWTVVPLRELVRRLEAGEPVGGLLAITFDDGYRDNWTTAAPLLRQHGLPATFFVTTEFIQSDQTPWWDAQEGLRAEWMTWDEVRALAAAGFEVAPHTRTHADLGIVTGDDAADEIVGARDRLRQEIGDVPMTFAYPYGRPEQMSEENRARVRAAGLLCCASAHGGVVEPGTDPFRLPRTAISAWQISPWQFGFELARRWWR